MAVRDIAGYNDQTGKHEKGIRTALSFEATDRRVISMKNFKTDLIVISALLFVSVLIWFAVSGDSTIDLQMHDTYLVVDTSLLLGLIIGPLGFLIFLTRAIVKRFTNPSTNICLAIELVIIAVITYYIIQVQEDYANELRALEGIDTSVKERIVDTARSGVVWSWCIFVVWCIAFVLLSLRIIRIWKTRT